MNKAKQEKYRSLRPLPDRVGALLEMDFNNFRRKQEAASEKNATERTGPTPGNKFKTDLKKLIEKMWPKKWVRKGKRVLKDKKCQQMISGLPSKLWILIKVVKYLRG